ncbi:MAG TPA: hypothetical protein VGR70_21530 [Stellaceae bacterium]|nr:hypothetical protein [Stellaceae bacterium]
MTEGQLATTPRPAVRAALDRPGFLSTLLSLRRYSILLKNGGARDTLDRDDMRAGDTFDYCLAAGQSPIAAG